MKKKIIFSEIKRKALNALQGNWLKFSLCLMFSGLLFLMLVPDRYIYSFFTVDATVSALDMFLTALYSSISAMMSFTLTAAMYRVIFFTAETEKKGWGRILKEANTVFSPSIVPVLLTKVSFSFLSAILTPVVYNGLYDNFLMNMISYPVFMWIMSILEILILVGNLYVSLAFILLPCVVADNPNLPGLESLKLCHKLMKKRKFNMFWLLVSFIPWYLLGSFVILIGAFFVESYLLTTLYFYYKECMDN